MYSFGIIVHELETRDLPFGACHLVPEGRQNRQLLEYSIRNDDKDEGRKMMITMSDDKK